MGGARASLVDLKVMPLILPQKQDIRHIYNTDVDLGKLILSTYDERGVCVVPHHPLARKAITLTDSRHPAKVKLGWVSVSIKMSKLAI
jgi:hypothetical protein